MPIVLQIYLASAKLLYRMQAFDVYLRCNHIDCKDCKKWTMETEPKLLWTDARKELSKDVKISSAEESEANQSSTEGNDQRLGNSLGVGGRW